MTLYVDLPAPTIRLRARVRRVVRPGYDGPPVDS